jgi:hypothetical protein
MNGSAKVGTTGEEQLLVEPKQVIDFADGEMPAALCTPSNLVPGTRGTPGRGCFVGTG